MKKMLKNKAIVGLALALGAVSLSPAAAAAASPAAAYHQNLSANVPLGSFVYDYLEKLDGLGYLKDMRTGAKPYSRMQIAKWVREINAAVSAEPATPQYVTRMLKELDNEFSSELSVLAGLAQKPGIALKEWSMGFGYYDGKTLGQNRTKSTYQPLNSNNNGYRYADKGTGVFSLLLEGKVNDHLVVSATPRVSYDDTDHTDVSLISGYVKTHINNMEVQLGKESLWWGQGTRGSLLLTNNSKPKTLLKLSSMEPMQPGGMFRFLGDTRLAFFYTELEKSRSDVPYPSFVGFRMDSVPSSNFTFGLARADMVGGKGHMLNGRDYPKWLFGVNADTAEEDQWNAIAGVDFRWRLPKANGLQLYGEFYGEDQAGKLPPLPRDNAGLFGLYIPRLSASGDWDAHLEWARTTNAWYVHSLYTEGYTYKGSIMGDAMGNNAERYYGRLTHYLSSGSRLALHGERVEMDYSAKAPQTVNSFWVSLRTRLNSDMDLNASVGRANVKNAGFKSGNTQHNDFVNVNVTVKY